MVRGSGAGARCTSGASEVFESAVRFGLDGCDAGGRFSEGGCIWMVLAGALRFWACEWVGSPITIVGELAGVSFVATAGTGTGVGIGEGAGSDGCSVAAGWDVNPRESVSASDVLGSAALFAATGVTATARASSAEGDFFLTTTFFESAC